MNKRYKFLLLVCFVIGMIYSSHAQGLDSLKKELIEVDNDTSMLVSATGLNIFLQTRTLNYLTGVADLSLAKYYATYAGDNDKLNIGFNIPLSNPSTQRLAFILNPLVEADLKNNLSTLREKGKWQNNIRAGVKLTYLLPIGTLNFGGAKPTRKNELRALRAIEFRKLDSLLTVKKQATTKITYALNGDYILPLKKALSDAELEKVEDEAYQAVGQAEAKFLDENKNFTWYQTGWISAWGMLPVTEASKYISPNTSTAFLPTKFELWELNLQYTHLIENAKIGTFYASLWAKIFQNNSANADLLKKVDYGQYAIMPGAAASNLALIETNKAYIGAYQEFITRNLNLQFVYITPWNKTLIKPGISFRYEINWGDYSPTNLRLGLPLALQGKSSPINLELQYRWNDVSNYLKKADHEVVETFGISVGLPFSLLYK